MFCKFFTFLSLLPKHADGLVNVILDLHFLLIAQEMVSHTHETCSRVKPYKKMLQYSEFKEEKMIDQKTFVLSYELPNASVGGVDQHSVVENHLAVFEKGDVIERDGAMEKSRRIVQSNLTTNTIYNKLNILCSWTYHTIFFNVIITSALLGSWR